MYKNNWANHTNYSQLIDRIAHNSAQFMLKISLVKEPAHAAQYRQNYSSSPPLSENSSQLLTASVELHHETQAEKEFPPKSTDHTLANRCAVQQS